MTTTIRKNGVEESYFAGMRQASILPSQSGYFVESIRSFIYSAPLTFRFSDFQRGTDGNGLCKMHFRGVSFVYDPTNGFVNHYTLQHPPDGYILDRVQCLPLITSNNIPIGRIIAEAKYHPGEHGDSARVRLMLLYVSTEAEVNPVVDSEVFKLSVPSGTTVVKFDSAREQGLSNRQMEKTTQEIKDARAFAETTTFGMKKPFSTQTIESKWQDDENSLLFRILLVVNGLFAIAFTAYFLVQRLRRSPS